jgi:hypothetical protein
MARKKDPMVTENFEKCYLSVNVLYLFLSPQFVCDRVFVGERVENREREKRFAVPNKKIEFLIREANEERHLHRYIYLLLL